MAPQFRQVESSKLFIPNLTRLWARVAQLKLSSQRITIQKKGATENLHIYSVQNEQSWPHRRSQRRSPRDAHPHVMHNLPNLNLATSTNNIMSHNHRIEAALADLESQEVPNYSMTAKKHGVVRMTLMRRFTGKTVSNYETNTESRQALNFAQQKVLLGHIQRLVTRGWGLNWKELDHTIYTTPLSTVKNVARMQHR